MLDSPPKWWRIPQGLCPLHIWAIWTTSSNLINQTCLMYIKTVIVYDKSCTACIWVAVPLPLLSSLAYLSNVASLGILPFYETFVSADLRIYKRNRLSQIQHSLRLKNCWKKCLAEQLTICKVFCVLSWFAYVSYQWLNIIFSVLLMDLKFHSEWYLSK